MMKNCQEKKMMRLTYGLKDKESLKLKRRKIMWTRVKMSRININL